jgi:tetratricopeptide (TPR) repeat protein
LRFANYCLLLPTCLLPLAHRPLYLIPSILPFTSRHLPLTLHLELLPLSYFLHFTSHLYVCMRYTAGVGDAAHMSASWQDRKIEAARCFKTDDFEGALREYDACNEAMPDDCTDERPKILTNIAICLLKLRRGEEAVKTCDKCLHLKPRDEKAFFRRAQANEMVPYPQPLPLPHLTIFLSLRPQNICL